MIKTEQLIWDGNNYQCTYEGGTLYVSGDAWAEARLERARAYFHEAHPEIEEDDANELFNETFNEEASESSLCYDKATDELLDPWEWASDAVEVDEEGMPLDPKITWSYYAWFRKEAE